MLIKSRVTNLSDLMPDDLRWSWCNNNRNRTSLVAQWIRRLLVLKVSKKYRVPSLLGSGRLQRAWACWVCKVFLCFSWGRVGRIGEKMQPGVPNACQCRGRGFSPWSRKIPHAMRQLSPCTTTTEPVCCKEWSPSAYSLCSVTRQATAMRSPRTTMRSSPWSLQSEKAHAKQQRPSAVKYKK